MPVPMFTVKDEKGNTLFRSKNIFIVFDFEFTEFGERHLMAGHDILIYGRGGLFSKREGRKPAMTEEEIENEMFRRKHGREQMYLRTIMNLQKEYNISFEDIHRINDKVKKENERTNNQSVEG